MFKKVTHIIWILIAVAFLGLMALKIKIESTIVYRLERTQRTSLFFKVNKLTGSVQVRDVTWSKMSDWKTPEKFKQGE
jgi:hypothetical protein